MGLLSKLFGNKNSITKETKVANLTSVPRPNIVTIDDSIMLSGDVTKKLSLRKETARISLKKNNLETTTAQVEFVLDYSGSFRWAYRDGVIQELTERIMGLALNFDDDGMLPVYGFGVDMCILPDATVNNLGGYINKCFNSSTPINGGGTYYAPAIRYITDKHKDNMPGDDPVFIVFITDGDNNDKDETDAAMIEASKYNLFFKFVGVGDSSFSYLRKLDDELPERIIDNANFQEINDISDISDSDLYDKLVEEFKDYLSAYASK